MAHYAKIDLNNKVMSVVVVADADCQNADGVEIEEVGRQFLENCFGWPLWIKCSYNTIANTHKKGGTPFRKNYPGVGWTWDEDRDAFYMPKPFNSWILEETTCLWKAPVDYPTVTIYGDPAEAYLISWDEDNLRWKADDQSEPVNSFGWDVDSSSWVAI